MVQQVFKSVDFSVGDLRLDLDALVPGGFSVTSAPTDKGPVTLHGVFNTVALGTYATSILGGSGAATIIAGGGDHDIRLGGGLNTIILGDGNNTVFAGNEVGTASLASDGRI